MKNRKKQLLGFGLIFLGLFSLMSIWFDVESYLFMTGSIIFLIVYGLQGGNKYYRNIGFLIPGLFMIFLQGILWFEDVSFYNQHEDLIVITSIGTVFLLIFLIHSFWFFYSPFGKRFWPFIVSVIIYGLSLIVYMDEYLDEEYVEFIFKIGAPVALILAGSVICIRGLIKTDDKYKEDK